jgi:hypothetical protein
LKSKFKPDGHLIFCARTDEGHVISEVLVNQLEFYPDDRITVKLLNENLTVDNINMDMKLVMTVSPNPAFSGYKSTTNSN